MCQVVTVCDSPSSNGHTETVALLLQNGAQVNMQNNDGWSSLIIASGNGQLLYCFKMVHKSTCKTMGGLLWSLIQQQVILCKQSQAHRKQNFNGQARKWVWLHNNTH